MRSGDWDPGHYLTYADERARPFLDLLARVPASAPGRVVDLGCGPGTLTALLARRWPDAHVLGVDASAAMVQRARELEGVEGLEVRHADLRDWAAEPGDPVDVLVTNATLQWVPGHLALLPTLVSRLAPGGLLALQVPGNQDAPSHALLRRLGAREPYAEHLVGVAFPRAHDPADYLEVLAGAGCTVEAWETTYLHVLTGPDPVLTWVSATGARPTLDALPDDLRPAFVEAYRAALAEAYPPGEHGTVLPFRRVFAVARRG
ncbi:trans-aconitate 2-methyltransferase [Nocardioides bruguierae]|uniref:Trans-aconitate 2-methyltransferase n=1 Tax=Nocardioides bruguierae TaxID=2945102 RepID=A0A9X2IEE0_9ACTN|nr:trans-aconitate 2-methyltransferase [Nocardioides bruguierae]MCM0620197.1 trans-aconitate 2-methyltransferase [Nocardioides bruguierae]